MAPKPSFNPRAMMERTIEVMRRSVPERRADGKPVPRVGALLFKPDGTVETACRGELRSGDHAEFTLLERKNRSSKLDGSILFSTLEPCAPGARREGKMSCAERIVLARIAEVWVGVTDPHPTVDRKGIAYLEAEGVRVRVFDRDLQDVIRSEDRAFFTWAQNEAADTDREKPKEVVLSALEGPQGGATLEDLSSEALEQYRTAAGIEEAAGSYAFRRRLGLQGLLRLDGKTPEPTGFGILLFGVEPRVHVPQAGLLATIHYPDGREELRDFDGPLVLIPGQLEQWLRDKLPNLISRDSMQRRQVDALPFEMVREAVVNALIHRDYDIRGAKCQIAITTETVTVRSPGGPLKPVTLEQLQTFQAPMLSRNPELHYVAAKMDFAEERGLGITSLRTSAEKHGLPLPKYTFEAPYLVLTLYRTPESAARVLPPRVLAGLGRAERRGWQWVATQGKVRSSEYARVMKVDERTARRHLNRFQQLGLLRKAGSGPSTQYLLK
jgi:ATP-dependent DNA helicase RecG